MGLLAYITFLGIALAGIGAVLLGGLAYGDFKERGKLGWANGAICGILLLFLGFFIGAGSYVWPIGKWTAVIVLIVIAIVSGLLGCIIALLFRRSKGP
jgi:hypothetical protein